VKITIGRPGIEINPPKLRQRTPPMPGSSKKVQINNTPLGKSRKRSPKSRKKNRKKMRPMKEVKTPRASDKDDEEEEDKTPEPFAPTPAPPSPKKKYRPTPTTPGIGNIPAADIVKTPLSDYGLANALNDSVLVLPSKDRNPEAFIPNDQIQYRNQAFGANEGIDFYIDGARFLPDNTTVTKCIIRAFNYDMVRLIQRSEGTPDVQESTTFIPYFGFRYEFRLPRYDPTTIVAITIETIDKSSLEIVYLGHVFFPLFLDKKTKKPTADPSAQDFILQEGNYQLPIYCQRPPQNPPFTFDIL